MKRFIAFMLAITMAIMGLPFSVSAAVDIEDLLYDESIIVWKNGNKNIYVEGNKTKWNFAPKNIENITMVPFKLTVDVLGGEFDYWDSTTNSAHAKLNGKTIIFTKNSNKYFVDGSKKTARCNSIIIGETLYVDVRALTKIADKSLDYKDDYVFVSDYGVTSKEERKIIDYLYYGIQEQEVTLDDIKSGKVYAISKDGLHLYKRVYDSSKKENYIDEYAYTFKNINLPKDTVLIEEGNYLYSNGEKVLASVNILKNIETRINQLNHIIDGAKNAHENDTISKRRKNKIISNAEDTIEEYIEVANGELKFSKVEELTEDYEAKFGDKNNTVEEIQKKLFDLGYTSQHTNGYYDNITFNNIAYFQIVNSLDVTGWVNDETYDILFYEEPEEIAEYVPEEVELEDLDWEEIEETKETNYLVSSVKQVAFGNFTDDVTLLGTSAQVGMGIAGIDLWADVRDITADIANWEWTWSHVGQTAIDIIALVPVIGGIKYFDEAALLVKNGDEVLLLTKHADEVADVSKNLDNVLANLKNTGNFATGKLKHIFFWRD